MQKVILFLKECGVGLDIGGVSEIVECHAFRHSFVLNRGQRWEWPLLS